MKLRSKIRTSPAIPLALSAMTLAVAMVVPAAGQKTAASPVTTLTAPSVVDPNTGLPITPSPQWKDPGWKDPDKILPEVSYDGLPVSEVAHHLQVAFKDAFDILIPNGWR